MSILHIYRMLSLGFSLLYRTQYIGRHHLPKTGAYLLCPNHSHNLDPFILAPLLHRKTYFMAKSELFKHPFIARLLHSLGAFPVDRKSRGTQSIKRSLRLLKSGNPLCIFPEGTRTTESSSVMKSGPIRLAASGAYPIIPVRILGTYRPFGRMTVIVGEPYTVPNLATREELEAERARLHAAIYGLTLEGK